MHDKINSLLDCLEGYQAVGADVEFHTYLSLLLEEFKTRNYYEVMGFSIFQKINQQTLHQTYRTLAKRLHPDKHRNKSYAGLSEELFKISLNAYHTLRSPEEERAYRKQLFKNFENTSNTLALFCCIGEFGLHDLLGFFSNVLFETVDEFSEEDEIVLNF